MRHRWAVFLPLLLSGCFVSRTHIGIHNFGDGNLWDSVVGKRYVEGLRDTEDDWMRQLARLDLDGLAEHFTPALAQKLNASARQKLALQIQREFRPTGYFTRRRFATPALSWGRPARSDAFDYYDMIGYAYEMEGKTTGCVQFYITRVDGETAICGLEILPVTESDHEHVKEVRYVVPETVNKAKVNAQPGMLMKRLRS